jgi:hypothetical protein
VSARERHHLVERAEQRARGGAIIGDAACHGLGVVAVAREVERHSHESGLGQGGGELLHHLLRAREAVRHHHGGRTLRPGGLMERHRHRPQEVAGDGEPRLVRAHGAERDEDGRQRQHADDDARDDEQHVPSVRRRVPRCRCHPGSPRHLVSSPPLVRVCLRDH